MAEAPAPAVVSEGEAPTPAAVSEEAPTSSMYFYCCESGPTNDANDNDDVWNEPGWGGRKERGTGACKMTANPTYATGVPQRLSHPPPYPLHLALTQRWRRQRWTRPGRHRRRVTVCWPIGTGARARAAHLPCLISPRCVRLLFLPPCARGRTPPARVLGELRAVRRSQGDAERVVQQRAEAQRERRGDVLLAGWSDPAPISRGGGGWRVRGAVARERCSTIAMRHAGRASCVCGPRIWPRLD